MSHYHGRFIEGDLNEDGSRFLPFEDDLMRYDNHQYFLKTSGIKTKLGIDLSSLIAAPLTDLVVLDEISVKQGFFSGAQKAAPAENRRSAKINGPNEWGQI